MICITCYGCCLNLLFNKQIFTEIKIKKIKYSLKNENVLHKEVSYFGKVVGSYILIIYIHIYTYIYT